MADLIFHDTGHGFFNLMDPWIAILINPAAGCTDNMVVLFAQIGFFELGNIFTELMFHHQAAVEQQFHRIVQGRPAHPVIVVLHVDIQFLNIEVALPCIHFIQDGKSFRCFPLAFSFNILRKDLPDGSLDVGAVHTL